MALIRIERRHKYIIQSVLAFIYVYLLFFRFNLSLKTEFFLTLIFVGFASVISHYPNIKVNNIVFGMILPMQLFLGMAMFLRFFPNLNSTFRLVIVAAFSVLYYITSLVDNIFLVIHDREEQIPLYRVAVTLAQILSIIISIPLFASIFKISVNGVIQSAVVSISALLFSIYQFWGLGFDKDAKKPSRGEMFLLNTFVMFLVFVASVSVTFFPTESFLRALYVSAVLMFGLNFVDGYLKNDINAKNLSQFIFIVFLFFLLLLVFLP